MEVITSIEENTSNDELEELDELDEPWKELPSKSPPITWSDDTPLSDELKKLNDELKQETDEARAWLEEEWAANEFLRTEIDQLKIAREQSEKQLAIELKIPPEVREKIKGLENQVRTLQDKVQEKSLALTQSYEVYSEILTKLDKTNERVIENDIKFKEYLLGVKEEYAECEAVLRNNLETYKSLNKQLQFQLSEKESELANCKGDKSVGALQLSLEALEKKLEETNASCEQLNTHNLELKAQIKTFRKNETDALTRERESTELIESLKISIAQLEEERTHFLQERNNNESLRYNIAQLQDENEKLLKERSDFEDVETLKNKIALLEEEKGNLQLQLVDLDELKENADSIQSVCNELEIETAALRIKLKSNLEHESSLTQSFEQAKKQLEEQEYVISSIKSALEVATGEKISAVMKSVEIEELYSIKEKEIAQLKEQLVSIKEEQSLKEKSDFAMAESIQFSKVNLEERAKLEEDLISQGGVIEKLNTKITQLKAEMDLYKRQNQNLLLEVESLHSRNADLDLQLSETVSTSEKLKQQMLTSQPIPLDKEVSAQKYKQLAASFKKKKQLCQELENNLQQLKPSLDAKEETISQLVKDNNFLQHKLREYDNRIKSLEAQSVARVEPTMFEDHFEELSESVNDRLIAEKQLQDQINQQTLLIVEKERIIAELQLERTKLLESVKSNEEEIVNLKTISKESSLQNENYFLEIKRLQNERVNNTDLSKHLEEVTKNYNEALTILQKNDNDYKFAKEEIKRFQFKINEMQSLMGNITNVVEYKLSNLFEKIVNSYQLSQKTISNLKMVIKEKTEDFEREEELLKTKIVNLEVESEDTRETANFAMLRNITLEKELKEVSDSVKEMSNEVDTLRNIKDAYNTTLDNIEKLNGELRESVEGFERMNNRIYSLEQEREDLIMKLNEFEDSYNDLENKLEESENNIEKLILDIKGKETELEDANNNINMMKSQLELVNSNDFENRYNLLMIDYQEKLNEISRLEEVVAKCLKQTVSEDIDNVVKEAQATASQVQQEFKKEEPIGVFTFTDPGQSDNPFGDLKDEEDGWGWMGGDHQVVEIEERPANKLQELNSKISTLEEEHAQTCAELETVKLKCHKYAKKIREMKHKIDNLEKAETGPKVGFSDLDFALQEELRNENDTLQTKIKESNTQLTSMKRERESLLKRVDTLTTANEQLFDMKERQDIEVQMWQKRSNELGNQVQGLQWMVESMKTTVGTDLAGNYVAAIKEIDELKARLASKREKLKEVLAEKNEIEKNILDQSNYVELENQYTFIVGENDKLMTLLGSKNKEIELITKEKVDTENRMKTESEYIADECKKLTALLDSKNKEIELLLKEKLEIEQKIRPEGEYSSIVSENDELKLLLDSKSKMIETLLKEKSEIELGLKSESEYYDRMKLELDNKNNEMEFLLEAKNKEIELITKEKFELEQKIHAESDYANIISENNELKLLLESKDQEIQSILNEKLEIENKLQSEREKVEVSAVKSSIITEEAIPQVFQGFVTQSDGPFSNMFENQHIPDSNSENIQQQITEYLHQIEVLTARNSSLENEVTRLNEELQKALMDCYNSAANATQCNKDYEILLEKSRNTEESVEFWKNKSEQLSNEITSKESLLQDRIKEVKDYYQQSIFSRELEGNEEIKRLSALITESQERLQAQTLELQERNKMLEDAHNTMGLIQEYNNHSITADNDQLRQNLALLEQEKEHLESLLEDRLNTVDDLERELSVYKNLKNLDVEEKNVNMYKVLIEQKDLEISRLTEILNGTREKLVQRVQMEENRNSPHIRSIQNKLDKALCALHASDVKCEELTQEIMQLLEERDSLQIRLSDCMRAYDAIKENQLHNIHDTVQQPPAVAKRVGELTMGYNKDPVVQRERESRHNQQMQLYNVEDPSEKEDNSTLLDYGIFNWFFGGSPAQGKADDVKPSELETDPQTAEEVS